MYVFTIYLERWTITLCPRLYLPLECKIAYGTSHEEA